MKVLQSGWIVAVVVLVGVAAWQTTADVEPVADVCMFDNNTVNSSNSSPCTGVNHDRTRFLNCPCKIDMDVSLSLTPCASNFTVTVNGQNVQNPSPTFAYVYKLDCDETHHSKATVKCCNGNTYTIAEYKGNCSIRCKGVIEDGQN